MACDNLCVYIAMIDHHLVRLCEDHKNYYQSTIQGLFHPIKDTTGIRDGLLCDFINTTEVENGQQEPTDQQQNTGYDL